MTATPNPNATQYKISVPCVCGLWIYHYANISGEAIVPTSNLWIHEETQRTACAHYLDALINGDGRAPSKALPRSTMTPQWALDIMDLSKERCND